METGFNAYDPSVGLPINSSVQAIVLQADGRILLGGDFTTLGGLSRQRVGRLLPDGSADQTFDPGSGANSTVYSLALQPDGKVILGGRFTQVALAERIHLARLNATGALDTTFAPEADPDNAAVQTMALLGGGRIVIVGILHPSMAWPAMGWPCSTGAMCPRPARFNWPMSYRVHESDGVAQVVVRRLDGEVGPVTVHYQTNTGVTPDSAEEGGESLVPQSGQLSGDGDTAEQTINIPIMNDGVTEVEEYFTLTLSDCDRGGPRPGRHRHHHDRQRRPGNARPVL